MYDTIIVGAGPAGLTSALYLLRANKKVLILEAKSYGGQIINANKIENYPGFEVISGFDFATNLYRTVVTNKEKYQAKTVIIATGAEKRKLNIPNEVEFIGKGVSYCATCDGNFYKDKVVAVNGGGNTALEEALYLAQIASKVYLIHRRDEFRAENIYLEELKKHNNVEIILNSKITNLNGTDKLEKITIMDETNKQEDLEVAGLFIAIGQEPKNEIFTNVVDLNEFGYIKSEDGVHTKTKGIYVAGDTREKILRQLTTAVSDGSIAATTAIKEMSNLDS